MQTHRDSEHNNEMTRQWWASLEAKAAKMVAAADSTITAGVDGEPVLAEWRQNRMTCIQRPDDEHGILRISVGGDHPLHKSLNYCVFRGDRTRCAYLLEQAVRALREKE